MRRTLWLSVVLIAAVSWANPPQTFTQGSLIIPMQANFQNECAMTSAYGLVWKLLYENRPGGAFSGQPITVYWAIQGAKTSTNRCVPTNKHATPQNKSNVGILAGKTGWNTGVLNDGCDMFIENAGRMPVVPVDWNVAFPAGNIYNNNTIPQFDGNGSGQPFYDTNSPSPGKGTRPGTLDNSGTCTLAGGDAAPCGATRFTRVQYSGGAFVIDSADAKRVIDAINSGSYPHLQQHKSTNNSQCGGLQSGGASAGTFSTVTGAGGQVIIHQATTSFDAPIYKRITNTPPRIALVDFGGGTKSVLLNYLTRAQLQGDGSGNIAGQQVCGTPGSVGGITNCGNGTTGLIYDRVRGLDDLLTTGTYPKGLINSKLSGKSRYKVIWAPHWELDNANKASGAATNAERGNALDNLDAFGDQKGNGLLAECASIEGYEGSSAVPNYSSSGLSAKFMFNGLIRINGMSTTKNGRNCTDPWYNNGMCTVYGAPSDPFSQVGDYTYVVGGGHVESYTNTSDGTDSRKPNVKRLASSWEDYPSGSDNTGDNGWDYATLRQKDDDPEKATVIYVAGHDLSSDPAGTRIVLNTLLNLGADPIPSDRNYSSAVGFMDATNSNTPTLLSSIYQVVSGTLLPGAITYAKATGKNWMWPFTGGNVRIRNAGTLVAGQNELTDSVMANADGEMPLPNNRNLFTYFGGQTVVNPSLSGGRVVRNNVVQMGWVPERLEYNRINTNYSSVPNPACVDVMKWGDFKDRIDGANSQAFEAGGDGFCDLQQSFQWSKASQDVDLSGKHKLRPSEVAKITGEATDLQQFIQRVRGYCFATKTGLGLPIVTTDEIMQPTDAECTDMGGFSDNRAHIGGAVRSSAAIVPPSAKITDAGAARPTVAYVGTWDGQLHAIYIGGGAGYTGPAAARPHLNADAVCSSTGTTPCTGGAVNTFKTNWGAAAFVPPNRGTELWSFIPPSQLFWLRTNAGMVDSSPVVQDVFIDPYGTGKRSWHTVLIVSIGGTGRELFAFDVTNPLKPALLWDVVGSIYQVGSDPEYTGSIRSDFDLKGSGVSLEWDNSTTNYKLDLTVTDPGRKLGYPYDYTDLGGSRALAIGQMREGLIPTYAVFVSSNSSNRGGGGNDAQGRNMSKSINVFAIDIETGQKIWQWRHPYAVAGLNSRNADNTVPPPVSVLNSPDGAGVVYVGDMEGRIWELDASTGRNLNALRDGASCNNADCNFALFDTRGTDLAPEPITSNLAIAKVPSATTASTPLYPYGNELVMVVGTGGTKWVPSTVSGKLHTILLNKAPLLSQAGADRRKPVLTGVGKKLDNVLGGFHASQTWDLSSVRASVSSTGPVGDLGGVAQDPVGMPFAFSGGDRVFGYITISGNTAFVPIVTGQGADPLDVLKDQTGKSLEMPLGNLPGTVAAAQMTGYNYANYGGLAVFEVPNGASTDVWIAGDQVSKTAIEKNAVGSTKANEARRNTAMSTNPSTPYRLYNVVRRFFSQQ